MKKFGALLFLSLALSCTPDIKEKEAQLGKEATAEEFQKAIQDALGDVSLAKTQVGQFVDYEKSVRADQGKIMVTEEINNTLKEIKENPEKKGYLDYIIEKNFIQHDFSSGEDKVTFGRSEIPVPILKPPPPGTAWLKALSNENLCDGQDVVDDDGVIYDCIKIFNLVSKNRLAEPPLAVKANPDCNGLPNCLMNIHYLQWDQIKWRKEAAVEKITLTAEFAPQVPDLFYENKFDSTPPSLSFCVKGTQIHEGSRYKVSNCIVLRNYR